MMQKPMLTVALLLFSAQAAQALSNPLSVDVDVDVDVEMDSSFQTHLPAAATTATTATTTTSTTEVEVAEQQTVKQPSNRTIGENNHKYSFLAAAKDQVEASRFLLETPITSCISLVTEVGEGPAVCHAATHNANSFVDLQDVVPNLVDYTNGDSLPITILDQKHSHVDFRISQDWFDGDIGAFSVFHRPNEVDSACNTYADVSYGAWSQDFTAKCYFNKAEVKLYMRWCGKEDDESCTENCDLCRSPSDGDLSQYMELSFEIDCDPSCARDEIAENSGFDPFDLICEDEDTEQLDGFLGDGAQDCNANLIDVDEDNLPIKVVERSRDGETVVFELTQDYYEGAIVKWGVHHRANATFQDCDVEHDIAYNETRQFTTKCWYGQAAVTLYVYLCELEPHDDCDVCSAPESMDNFMQYAYNIACYRPCDNDTDIIPFDDPVTDPPPEATDPPEENNDEDPKLPGFPNDCATLVTADTVGKGGATCTVGGEYQNLISGVDNMEAIDIVSATGDSVEFRVSQNFVEGEVFRLSVFYDNAISEHNCNTYMDVETNWEGTFTAVCFENKAAVKFYFRFCENNEDEECNFCETPASLDDYLELTVALDCSETCDPSYTAPIVTWDPATEGGNDSGGDFSDPGGPTEPTGPTGPVADRGSSPTEPSPSPPSGPTDPAEGAGPTEPTGPTPTEPSPPTPTEPTGPTPTEPTAPTPTEPTPPTPTEPTGPTPTPPTGPTPTEPSPPTPTEPTGPTPTEPSPPTGPTPTEPSSPTGPTPTEPSPPTGPTPTEPSPPTGPTPTEPSPPTGPTPTEPSPPTGPTPTEPSPPTGPTPTEPSPPTGPTPTEPSPPTGPTPTEPSPPTGPTPTEPSPPTAPTPTEPSPAPPTGDNCSDLSASACPADVVLYSTTGTTPFPAVPIRIQSQTDTTVTFSVDNTFDSVLENVYVEYYSLADGTATCAASSSVGLCAAHNISYTAHCTGGSPQTLIDMWVTDSTEMDPELDDALIPNTCGAVFGGSSTVKYTFELYCQSTCTVQANRRLLRGGGHLFLDVSQ